jgi:hypothetical protein
MFISISIRPETAQRGTEDWAHFGQRSRRVLRNTVPEDAIFVLAGTWWFMALLKERKEPGTLDAREMFGCTTEHFNKSENFNKSQL